MEQRAAGVQRRVLAIRGTCSTACTPRGLCPGMPISEAGRLYGFAEPVQREFGTLLEYQPPDFSCWLQISARAGKVQALGVACQP
jgi:hypothetical protein